MSRFSQRVAITRSFLNGGLNILLLPISYIAEGIKRRLLEAVRRNQSEELPYSMGSVKSVWSLICYTARFTYNSASIYAGFKIAVLLAPLAFAISVPLYILSFAAIAYGIKKASEWSTQSQDDFNHSVDIASGLIPNDPTVAGFYSNGIIIRNSVAWARNFAKNLTTDTTIKKVGLAVDPYYGNKLDLSSDIWSAEFAAALRVNKAVTSLTIYHCLISDAGCIALAAAIEANKTLKALVLRQLIVSPAGAKTLINAIGASTSIKYFSPNLRLNNCVYTDNVAKDFAVALTKNQSLERLSLCESMSPIAWGAILKAIIAKPYKTLRLEPLDFRASYGIDKRIEEQFPADILAAFIASNRVLEELWLCGTIIDTAGLKLIATKAAASPSLRKLSIKSQGITDESAKDFAVVLETSTSLQVLDLSYNNIGDEGAIALAAKLKSPSCKLQKLYLYDNSITEIGATALAEALKAHPSLEFIGLDISAMEKAPVFERLTALSTTPGWDKSRRVRWRRLPRYLSDAPSLATTESPRHTAASGPQQ